jgi:hypothetical protein
MAAAPKAEHKHPALSLDSVIVAISEQFRGARFSGFVLVLLGALTVLLVLVNGVALCRSLWSGADADAEDAPSLLSMFLLPLIPLLMVAGVHWVSWRLYLHNS